MKIFHAPKFVTETAFNHKGLTDPEAFKSKFKEYLSNTNKTLKLR